MRLTKPLIQPSKHVPINLEGDDKRKQRASYREKPTKERLIVQQALQESPKKKGKYLWISSAFF